MSVYESEPVRVRGQDFTGYRIAGAIAAVLLIIALAVQVWMLFDGFNRTSPEVRWGVNAEENGGSALASQLLQNRTRLQNERFLTGPSPDGPGETFKIGPEVLLDSVEMDDPESILTESWRIPSDETAAILRQSDRVIGVSSLPYVNANLFERPFARDWRFGLADVATHIGAFAILGFSLMLALLLAIRGRVPIAEGKSGKKVKRFNIVERATHWMTSASFILLALTGISIAYGDTLIRPFGHDVLGAVGWLATWGHALFVTPFVLGLAIMFVMWVSKNIPSKLDIAWLKRGGGFFSDTPDHPSARKFNAGQKLIFWSAILGGGAMIVTGFFLLFPFYFLGLEAMSWMMLLHAVFAVLLIAIFIGHIYIGSVGMQGAFWAMWNGEVDRNWAREHHDLWLDEVEGRASK
ncbi:formate dehydrogenase subunit gamma [Palleronia salina]|uniref:Formate dehydrogenase subunit gamma n=1 Tax=Palleronia salina TaxID=313368 RepID=A0A1M6BR11_9RHOB|nr:formate dehydrogenase subunit gamma [Palleronia salina]SHI51034.1 formate dehydrogenase subunit gamma [Palleronia salina]